ncbi:unnamed protein product [Acanthosepion pharaonis]|uniref:Uncharacterized protein n=1 Tax=Acanthosepion pharaonis TaxID=158019 RepID=A0A812BMP8_ACAPH|nr:unnamed protein product [Sepia pharaonis]
MRTPFPLKKNQVAIFLEFLSSLPLFSAFWHRLIFFHNHLRCRQRTCSSPETFSCSENLFANRFVRDHMFVTRGTVPFLTYFSFLFLIFSYIKHRLSYLMLSLFLLFYSNNFNSYPTPLFPPTVLNNKANLSITQKLHPPAMPAFIHILSIGPLSFFFFLLRILPLIRFAQRPPSLPFSHFSLSSPFSLRLSFEYCAH